MSRYDSLSYSFANIDVCIDLRSRGGRDLDRGLVGFAHRVLDLGCRYLPWGTGDMVRIPYALHYPSRQVSSLFLP
jgi:hypothetical protein